MLDKTEKYNFHNIETIKNKVSNYDVSKFNGVQNSYRYFLREIHVECFRHLENVKIDFTNPITVISGTNKIGKTSILLLIACSHENFRRLDPTSPTTGMKIHKWQDVMAFTRYENTTKNYRYSLKWRIGNKDCGGKGKRLATSKAWSGLGKKSSDDKRINAKIRDREVRIIDLERLLPARSFSTSLLKKTFSSEISRLDERIEQAFSYILELPNSVELFQIGSHINKICYLVKHESEPYSSYNAASGEEALISILKDVIESPNDTLILIDEIEAGLHPSIQRKLADAITYISWHDKKQFIITTHSPTLLSAFPQTSRRFIDKKTDGTFETISKISKHAAFSRMDSISYPLVNVYCEDELAKFIAGQVALEVSISHKYFSRLINIITSGPANEVENDYCRHKRNYDQMRLKIGYCCIFDGDKKDDPQFSKYFQNPSEKVFFLYPYSAPEKFLVNAYLKSNPNERLQSALNNCEHHSLFSEMTNLNLSTDKMDARSKCWVSFEQSIEYTKLKVDLTNFFIKTVTCFSQLSD